MMWVAADPIDFLAIAIDNVRAQADAWFAEPAPRSPIPPLAFQDAQLDLIDVEILLRELRSDVP